MFVPIDPSDGGALDARDGFVGAVGNGVVRTYSAL